MSLAISDESNNIESYLLHIGVLLAGGQLADEQIITGWYYPSFDYGFGALLRYPISDASGIDYLRFSIEERTPFGNQYKLSFREFDKKGMTNLTPHTSPSDTPAPNLSGKYSMPSATINGDVLVAYSTGSVNHFDAACAPVNQCESLKSGIYLIRSAATSKVNNPNEDIYAVRIITTPPKPFTKPINIARDIPVAL